MWTFILTKLEARRGSYNVSSALTNIGNSTFHPSAAPWSSDSARLYPRHVAREMCSARVCILFIRKAKACLETPAHSQQMSAYIYLMGQNCVTWVPLAARQAEKAISLSNPYSRRQNKKRLWECPLDPTTRAVPRVAYVV